MGTIWRTVLIVTIADGLIMSQVGERIQEQVCLIKQGGLNDDKADT